jgi:hypothetical protein
MTCWGGESGRVPGFGVAATVKRVWAYAKQHALKDGRGGIQCDAALISVFGQRRLDFSSLARALTPHLRGTATAGPSREPEDVSPLVRLSRALRDFWRRHDAVTLHAAASASHHGPADAVGAAQMHSCVLQRSTHRP